jgi:hypothetical protein
MAKQYTFASLFSTHGNGSQVNLDDPNDSAYDPEKAAVIRGLMAAFPKSTRIGPDIKNVSQIIKNKW